MKEADTQQTKAVYFPSFVEYAASNGTPEVIRHWSPVRTGIDRVDARNGARHFAEASAFAREIQAPYFLVCIVREMRSSGVGAIEAAFLQALASKATAGGAAASLNDQTVESLAMLRGCDTEAIRAVEVAAHELLRTANRSSRPALIHGAILGWLRASDTWIAEAFFMVICGAALKGALH